jgi:predicted phage terminase large subunit-like protein
MLHQARRILYPVGSKEEKEARADEHISKAREHFSYYRVLMNPRLMLKGKWFPLRLARELRQFYDDWKAGKRPVLMIATPPQHGKSLMVLDFAAWVAGHNPHTRIIYTSFSDRLSIRANLRMQRSLDNPLYQILFPTTYLAPRGGGGEAQRNFDILEFIGHDGYFRNTTVLGQITGEALDLGIIDDPIKGRAEANSELIRDKTWNWLTDDMFARFDDKAALLLIGTRWHVDDPAGRLIEHYGARVRVVKFPAIAERDEANRKQGQPLFPELKSLEFLQDRRKLYTQGSWEALYQQNPIIIGGGIFPIERLHVLPTMVDRGKILRSVRYVDKAGTEEGGAYTAMVLMHVLIDKTYVIEHVVRGQWSALEREERIKFWAKSDLAMLRSSYEVGVEQEPGSGGKESAESTIRNLAGFKVYADKVTGDKVIRAEPFAAQVQGGNVALVAGAWVHALLDEMESFPNGKYQDQVDACSGAFNRLISGYSYNLFAPGLYE